MKIFHKVFQRNNNKIVKKENYTQNYDQYIEIGKLIKEARIKNKFSIKELSALSKIPESTIDAIENNIKDLIPKYPFIRSILYKLEKCLFLEINTLVGLVKKEKRNFKKDKKKYLIRKFEFLNSWQGSVFYFIFLIFTLFIINRYFISNITTIEIKIMDEKANAK